MFPQRRKREPMGLKDPTVIKSPGHLQFCRGFACGILGKHDCQGRIEAHHVQTRGAGGGDDQVVPLCSAAHAEIHAIGRDTFAAKYKVNLAEIAARLWKVSAHRIKWEQSNG